MSFTKICLTSALASLASAIQLDQGRSDEIRFNSWAAQHNKGYKNSEERTQKYAAWLKKDRAYDEINKNQENTFVVGHNHFSDWTDEEYKKLLTYKPRKEYLAKHSKVSKLSQVQPIMLNDLTLDHEVNWIDKGAVNAVKN